ncbi:MAG: 2-C-methyl-D-erythritol 2,4-cyclodiphosphate synthase [Bacteroidota bacterium]|nr:2-C-methyl-D-erythritol 2,4-cyclodiphosphate synthase [Bacteroidota bacterium]
MRIGYGYDVHAFEPGTGLILGGVNIPYHKKFKAHSDGDVLLHAICDALLGAAALGDIGKHFPDTDAKYHNISSIILLEKSMALIRQKGYNLQNIDSTIVLQAPKISPFILEIRESIANHAYVPLDAVSVKATTTENLGFVGEEKGAEAHAVVLLKKIS